MSKGILSKPLPDLSGPCQPGIVDPVWPGKAPTGVDKRVYHREYAGRLERQRHLHIIRADVTVRTRPALAALLKDLTTFSITEMKAPPSPIGHRDLDPPLESRRLSITVGFGASLFTTKHGDDRFGFAALRPTALRIMPPMYGDEQSFRPRDEATDLVLLVASDDFYVNEHVFRRMYNGDVNPGIRLRGVERGYARPDTREPSGFEDGVSNPKDIPAPSPMRHFVFVQPGDDEPKWCINGTYLAYRKVRRRLRAFFAMPLQERKDVFGVNQHSGLRFKGASAHSHALKMNPRRQKPDLFDIKDDTRRFLRRPYFFDDGIDSNGEELRGVHHISFVRNLATQYEWPVFMWQLNEDFPRRNTGPDALYTHGGASNSGGGYFFVPAAPDKDGYFGSELISAAP